MHRIKLLFLLLLLVQQNFAQDLSAHASLQLRQWQLENILTDKSDKSALRIVHIWDSLYPSQKSIIFNVLSEQEWQIILEKQYQYAVKRNNDLLQFLLSFPLATVYHTQSEFTKGLPLFEKLYQQKNKLSASKYAMVLVKLEEEYREMNDMSHAFNIRNERVEKGFINTFWELYANCNLWKEAIQDYQLFEHKPQENGVPLMKYYWFLGDLHFKNNQFDSAYFYYQQGAKEATVFYAQNEVSKKVSRDNASYWAGNFAGLMGNCFFEMGKIESAIPLLQEDLKHSVGRYKIRSLIYLTECYLLQNKITLAGENIDTLRLYLQGRSMKENEFRFYKAASNYFKQLKQFDAAFLYLQYYNDAYENWGRSILKNQSAFLLAKMELQKRRTELAQSNVALENAKFRSHSQRQQLYLLFGSLLAVIIIALLIYRNNLQKAASQKSIEAQNEQLKTNAAQITLESNRNKTLLKELHHRVKNNLQLIYSLINLQKRRVHNDESQAVLLAIQSRILSMSSVHERLYLTGDIDCLEAAPYVESLVHHLKNMHQSDILSVQFFLDIDTIQFNVEQAIAIGLIINEAISNAFKYAFINRDTGKFSISIKKVKDQIHIQISDDGPGLTSVRSEGAQLGMKIIQSMCDQLKAQLSYIDDQGLSYAIKFNV